MNQEELFEQMTAKELSTILKLVEEKETTFVQTEKPKKIPIDKDGLRKLLFNKPQASLDPVRLIRIRCDRIANQWALFDDKGKHALMHFTCGILKDATLSSKEIPAMGCGGADYVGMASGDMISEGQPVTVPNDQVHRLVFDHYEGEFYDRETRNLIIKVDYLILKEGCHAEYIKARK